MSISLQNTLRERKWFGHSLPRKQSFEKRIYADSYTINHMSQERELTGHSGCVNTLDWSLSGDKLLTGSDDAHLCIYDTYNDYKLNQTIHTGHRANIFSAKFILQTSEKRLISCAGDSELRIFDNGELIQMYVCHSDQTKRICVYHDNPNEFLSCSQDGTVRHFDLRVPHICTPHNVKSFLTSENKPAKQTLIHPNASHGCHKPIVDYSRYKVELNAMAINQKSPHYFAVAGMTNYIYLHDRRMMGSATTSSSSTSRNLIDGTRCVKRFTSGHNNRWSNNHITACQFAKSNSEELIGSWSSDGIYLFNINDESPIESTTNISSSSRQKTSTHSSPIKRRRSTSSFVLEWRQIQQLIKENKFDEASTRLQPLLHQEYSSTINIVIQCLSAIISLAIYHRSDNDQYVMDATNAMSKAQEEQWNHAENWYSKWYLAVGYFLASGGLISFCNDIRERFLRLSYYYLQATMEHHDTGCDSMMLLFKSDLKKVCLREGCWPEQEQDDDDDDDDDDEMNDDEDDEDEDEMNDDEDDEDEDEDNDEQEDDQDNNSNYSIPNDEDQWRWITFLYLGHDTDPDDDDDDENVTDDRQQQQQQQEGEEENEDDSMLSDTSTQSDNEDDISMYTEIFSSRGIRDIIEVSDSSSDVESDFETYRGYGIPNRNLINENVGIVKHRSKYKGHCNIETIKDVDFFGPNDEYIVSGSDGGDLFIWDKKTTQLLQILHADNEIVNVAKGHPHFPILAISGIDSTTKIFSPILTRPITKSKLNEPNETLSYSDSSRMFAMDEITRMNDENNENLEDHMNITRNMIAVLTHFQRTYRRREERSETEDGSEEEEEEEEQNEDVS